MEINITITFSEDVLSQPNSLFEVDEQNEKIKFCNRWFANNESHIFNDLEDDFYSLVITEIGIHSSLQGAIAIPQGVVIIWEIQSDETVSTK